ncbi:MAG TPA: MFS transporter [Streptosporangiaceae bacterium]|nr:MFS transporter [Streptosporangiaceae bacterium]
MSRSRRSGAGLYTGLAGLFFGVNTAQLLFLPTAARAAGLGSLGVGVVIAVFTGIGVLTDLPASELANRHGVPVAMLAGCALTAAGTAFFLAGPRAWAVLAGALVLGVGTSFLMNPILGGLSNLAGDNQLNWQLANVCVQRAGGLIAIIALTAGGVSGPVPQGAWASVAGTAVIAVIALRLRLRPRDPAALAPEDAAPEDAAPEDAGPPPGRLLPRAVAVVRDSREAASGVALELVIPAMLVFGFSFLPQLRAGLHGALSAGTMLITREAAGLAVVTLAVLVLRPRRIGGIVGAALVLGAATMPLLAYSASPAARLVAMGANGAVITVGIVAANLHVYLGTTPATRMYGFALSGIVSRISGIVFPILYGWSAGYSPQALVWCACGTVVLAGALYAGLQSGRTSTVPAPGGRAGRPAPAAQADMKADHG